MKKEIKSRTAIEIAKMEHEEEKILFQLVIGGVISLMITIIVIGLQQNIPFPYISITILIIIYLASLIYFILKMKMEAIRKNLRIEIKRLVK